MRGKSTNRQRALSAWLGVFALLIQGLMPVGQAVPLAGTGDSAFLILCTGSGPRMLLAEPEQSAPENRPWSCPVCQASALGDSLTAPASEPVQPPAFKRAVARLDLGRWSPDSSLSAPWQARAPPLV